MALEKLNNGIEQAKTALSEVRYAVRALRPQVERVETLEGTLMVYSSPHRGFIIRIIIPWNAETAVQTSKNQ